MKSFKKIKEILEKKGIKYEIRPKEGYGLVEFWTDTAGQDIPTEFDFDGTPEGFVKEFVERAENYDVDEEVELFASMRGKRGVPDTIRELIDDCQEAKDTLLDIAKALKDGNAKSIDASLRGVGISETTGYRDPYKVTQIDKMLNASDFYAYLSGDRKTSGANTINLDEDVLKIVKAFYEGKKIVVKESNVIKLKADSQILV